MKTKKHNSREKASNPICNHCGNEVVLEKGPSYLPNFEYRCDVCEIGNHANFGLLWNEEDARKAWQIVNTIVSNSTLPSGYHKVHRLRWMLDK